MTAAHESHMGEYTVQLGGGPALGIYQVEPLTLYDSYDNYLNYRPEISRIVARVSGVNSPQLMQLQYNPIYATIIARLKYRRAKGALPPPSDTWAMAEYAKNNYNSHLGAATPGDYHDAYRRYVLS